MGKKDKPSDVINKWYNYQKEMIQGEGLRPTKVEDCDDIFMAERYRSQIMAELRIEIDHIQNHVLGEHQIKEINDFINTLIREKKAWDMRISQLGGPSRTHEQIVDKNGLPLISTSGYMYFGAAKALPGVREMLRRETGAEIRPKEELLGLVDVAYFGFLDECGPDGPGLLAAEAEAEERLAAQFARAHAAALRAAESAE